ncbi:MAG: SpoIIE family protein phosphatase [Bryobacter sp.]|jgi:sigma-B regulation protein RsbU (phosphoserine phosphatase)|nr:SpoIIE family protein phosphatase [Bryobacter sp.]
MGTRILVADDQEDVLTAARLLLKGEGFVTECASSPAAVLEALDRFRPDLLLMDLNYTRDTTSGLEGLELLDRIGKAAQRPRVVVMTAWGSIELAVEAMRRGASDFVLKPWENARLVETIRRHSGSGGLKPSEDLEIAARVQAGLLPGEAPLLETLECAAYCRQAGAVGGDFYDYIPLEGGRVVLVLGDIAGKGIGAALLMAHLQALLRATCHEGVRDLPAWVRGLNRDLRRSVQVGSYSTLFLGVYDDSSRRMAYVNCGHVPPLLWRSSGEVERLDSTAPPIGLLPDVLVESRTLYLETGDRLAVFSDGVAEASQDGRELGEQGFLELWREGAEQSPETLASRVVAWSGGEPRDDLTLLLATCR